MAEFNELKNWLDAWYERGEAAAAHRFISQYLQPLVRQVACRVRAIDDPDDCIQEVIIAFMDRVRRRGQAAEFLTFWNRKVRWLVTDYLRRQRRLRDNEALGDVTDAGTDAHAARQTAAAEGTEDRLIAALVRKSPERHAWLQARLAAMAATRRLFLLVHAHEWLLEFFTPEDWAALEARSGRDRAAIEVFFAQRTGTEAASLLPLLFAAEDIARDRERCLDTFRRGRARAVDDLATALSGEGP